MPPTVGGDPVRRVLGLAAIPFMLALASAAPLRPAQAGQPIQLLPQAPASGPAATPETSGSSNAPAPADQSQSSPSATAPSEAPQPTTASPAPSSAKQPSVFVPSPLGIGAKARATQPTAGAAPAPGFGATPGAPPAGSERPPAPHGIQVDRLGNIDIDTFGTLDPGKGGLGPDLWRGAARPAVERLIAALPDALTSPTLRDLQRRLLLSTATAPKGPADSGPTLAALRAGKLAAMGDVEDLKAYLAVLPGRLDDEGLARSRVEAGLLSSDRSGACADVESQVRRYSDLFWRKAQIFCLLAAGRRDEAEVGLELLREKDDKDSAFYALADKLEGGRPARINGLAQPTPLLLAMLNAAKAPLPAELLRSSDPVVLKAVAGNLALSAEHRLTALERAVELGLASPDQLAEAYGKLSLPEADIAHAVAKAQASYSPRTRAMLYRAIKAAGTPKARAAILGPALKLARGAGGYWLALAVDLPFVEAIAPAAEFADFAPEAARALFFAGKDKAAQGWLGALRSAAASNRDAADAATRLWPYDRLAAPRPAPWDEAPFVAWFAAEQADKESAGPVAEARAAHLLGLLSATGSKVPDTVWQAFYGRTDAPESGAMPAIALWHGLRAAGAGGRRGEAVAIILAAIGGRPVRDANPIALTAAVEALHRVGLEAEARRLAIEAAIADGL